MGFSSTAIYMDIPCTQEGYLTVCVVFYSSKIIARKLGFVKILAKKSYYQILNSTGTIFVPVEIFFAFMFFMYNLSKA